MNKRRESTLQFTDNVPREYKVAWLRAYSLIPRNLSDILEKNNKRITILQVTYEEMRKLQNKSKADTSVSPMCTDYGGNIYFLKGYYPPRNDIGLMIHEIGHQILWGLDQDKANKWYNLWTEIHQKHGCPGMYDITNEMLESGNFLSTGDAKDYHEGFAVLVEYLSGMNKQKRDLNNSDLKRKIEFGRRLKINIS